MTKSPPPERITIEQFAPNFDKVPGLNMGGEEYSLLRNIPPNLDFAQLTYTPASPISVPNGTTYNLYTDMNEGGSGFTRTSTEGEGKLIKIGVNSGVKSVKFRRVGKRSESVQMRVTLDYTIASSATCAIEVQVKRPTLSGIIAPTLIIKLDNTYIKGKADMTLYTLGENDPFYVYGFYPEINNQSGQTLTITKIDILITRIYR